jgi:hypothetical protein
MKANFDDDKVDLTTWNFDDELVEVVKPLIARISEVIDKAIREDTTIMIYDKMDGGPVVGVSIPLDDGNASFGAEVSLDGLMEECIQKLDPIDLKDWIVHLRRYLAAFEAALGETNGH